MLEKQHGSYIQVPPLFEKIYGSLLFTLPPSVDSVMNKNYQAD